MKNTDHQQLTARVQQLRGLCQVVSEELSSLAIDLKKGELKQLEAKEASIGSLRRQYETLKNDLIAFAALYQATPDPGGITSLDTLEPLLLAVNKSLKEAAIAVLAQVRMVKHREQDSFEPLASCISKATELHRAVDKVPLPDLHPDVATLADGTHPLAAFLSLVRDRQQMKEEKIAVIQDAIAGVLGNLLFIAALMGKLIIPEEEAQTGTRDGGNASEPHTVKIPAPPQDCLTPEIPVAAVKPEMTRAPKPLVTPEAAVAPVIQNDPEEVLEQRQILQDLLTMTEMKMQKMLKNGLVREDELSDFVDHMKKMESSRYQKSDFKEDFRQLQAIRAALEEMENKAFNPRKRLERTQGQRIK